MVEVNWQLAGCFVRERESNKEVYGGDTTFLKRTSIAVKSAAGMAKGLNFGSIQSLLQFPSRAGHGSTDRPHVA
jgi:hypothetical protein